MRVKEYTPEKYHDVRDEMVFDDDFEKEEDFSGVENDELKTCGYCGYENFKKDTHCHQCCNKF